MYKRWGTCAVVAIVFSLVISACGGGAGGDPVATVQEVFKAVEAKQFSRIADLACSAQKDEVAQTFDFGAQMAGALGGIDPQKVLDAMTFKLANMEYTEVSRSGDAAVVHVKGRLEISVDADKFKAIVVDVLKAQGLTDVDSSVLDQATSAMLQQFEEFGQDFDDDINVVNENGRWLVCR